MRKSRRTVMSLVAAGLFGASALVAAPAATAAPYGEYSVYNYPNSGNIGIMYASGRTGNIAPGQDIKKFRADSNNVVQKVKTGSGYCIQETLYIDGFSLPVPTPVVPPKIFYYDGDRTGSGAARANGAYVQLQGWPMSGYDQSRIGVYPRPAGGKCDTGRAAGTYV